MATRVLLACSCLVLALGGGAGLLFPKDSESRVVKEVIGLWHFRADSSADRSQGFREEWHKQPLSQTGDTILMPVSSSFNDITQNNSLRSFVGWVYYDRKEWIPRQWKDNKTRIMLRFESAHYNSIVWVNGHQVANHSGGHLPFEADITDVVTGGAPNDIMVAINNTLTPHTLPPGTLSFRGPPNYPEGYFVQELQFDFFNYAGIHRPVKLYTTPIALHIDDITVTTALLPNGSAQLDYEVEVGTSGSASVSVDVMLMGSGATGVNSARSLRKYRGPKGELCSVKVMGSIMVDNPKLWWPWTMSDSPGHLYPLQVKATDNLGESDSYRLAVGLRTVEVKGTQFLINGKPFYFMGVGKHEDAHIRGKGMDYPLIMKDVNLLQWLGANSFRTSHYPYSEELMRLCDQQGIVVIDESPATGLRYPENFDDETLQHHLEVMRELVQRDKNRPSVVMWSVANEPDSSLVEAEDYFKQVIATTRELDPTRPVTFACANDYKVDRVTQFVDVIAINRYYGWGYDPGHIETIRTKLSTDLNNWFNLHKKPMMLTEYGAGAVAGLHEDPPLLFTEDYQVELLVNYFQIFDEYRKEFLIGEMVWNFADFQTEESDARVNGNKKGLFTRARQPKAAAHVLRQRYISLGQGRRVCYDHTLYSSLKKDHCTV